MGRSARARDRELSRPSGRAAHRAGDERELREIEIDAIGVETTKLDGVEAAAPAHHPPVRAVSLGQLAASRRLAKPSATPRAIHCCMPRW